MSRATAIEIRAPRPGSEQEAYYELRWELLREPLEQPPGSERDELESSAHHMGAYDGDTLVGIGRLHFVTLEQAQIRYMATVPDRQGQGIGQSLLEGLETIARENGVQSVFLNARENAVEFYEQLGYRVTAPAPQLHGIPHFRMQKSLT